MQKTEQKHPDSHVSHDMIDAVRDFPYTLADSAYDTSDIYDYVFENTHALPVIGTNRKRVKSQGRNSKEYFS